MPLRMTPAQDAVMRWVREKIEDGTLKPGMPVPSGRALARESGRNARVCRAALRAMVADGTLEAAPSAAGRPRVPLPGEHADALDALRRQLSRTLAAARRAGGMTQPELAEKLGVSVTTVGHAETGRMWHGRGFWERAEGVLGGGLLALFDRYKAGDVEPAAQAELVVPVVPAAAAVLRVEVPAGVEAVTVRWPDGTEATVRPGRAARAA